MNLYAAIEARLSGDSAITAIVGSSSPRIYPGFATLDADLPHACVLVTGGESVMSHQGASGLGIANVQVTCWGATYNAASNLLEKVRLRLQGYSGAATGFTDFRVVRVSAPRDVPDASAGNEALKRYGVSREFTVHHNEAKPS